MLLRDELMACCKLYDIFIPATAFICNVMVQKKEFKSRQTFQTLVCCGLVNLAVFLLIQPDCIIIYIIIQYYIVYGCIDSFFLYRKKGNMHVEYVAKHFILTILVYKQHVKQSVTKICFQRNKVLLYIRVTIKIYFKMLIIPLAILQTLSKEVIK